MKSALATVSTLALLALCSCRTAPLLNQQRVMVQCPSREHMRNAITQAIHGRRWSISDEREGEIDASLNLREHVAKVRITYDADHFDIAYLDSTNLSYKMRSDGKQSIHKNYNSWIQNLVQDITLNAADPG